jgi:hypothetical protein
MGEDAYYKRLGVCSSVDRVLASEAKGRRFDSCQTRQVPNTPLRQSHRVDLDLRLGCPVGLHPRAKGAQQGVKPRAGATL